jgi:type I restriction enzyme S subunit
LHLDLEGLNRIKIPKVSRNTQVKLVESLRMLEESISLLELKIANSNVLLKSLINQIF